MQRIVLTIDVEDWFHILDYDGLRGVDGWYSRESRIGANMDRILSILDEHALKATFFCLGWVGEQFPQIIKRIADADHEIASHSYEHALVYTMSESIFKEDASRSRAILEDVSGKKVIGYRAPGFSVNSSVPWFFDALQDCGYRYDSSIFLADRAHGGWADFDEGMPGRKFYDGILEIPLPAASIMGRPVFWSGGGYFRITPSWLHKILARRTENAVFYLHPRDLDVGQPKLSLPPLRYFKYYAGIGQTELRFRKFLKAFEFETCEEVWQRSSS